MKKLQRAEIKKIKGGEDEVTCLKGCREGYAACIAAGGDINFCTAARNQCRYRCLGCNPICP